MKILILLVALLAAPVQAANLSTAFVPTGVFPCDGVQRAFYWVNTTGAPIYLRKIRLWQGVDKGVIADVGATVYASHPLTATVPQVVLASEWDHYAEPTTQHYVDLSLAPDYLRMDVGEWFTFVVGCTMVTGPVLANEQNFLLYFTTTQP